VLRLLRGHPGDVLGWVAIAFSVLGIIYFFAMGGLAAYTDLQNMG
jgi:hypothetical protein